MILKVPVNGQKTPGLVRTPPLPSTAFKGIDMNDATTSPAQEEMHLSVQDIAAFVDGHLSPRRRDSTITHLADCAECREEVAETREILLSTTTTRASRRWWGGAWITGIAAAAALLMSRPDAVGDRHSVAAERAAPVIQADGAPQLRLASPSADTTLVAKQLVRLSWGQLPFDATYHVVVQDSTGTPLWSSMTSDSSVMLPASLNGVLGAAYFWSVEAQLSDGRSSRSEVRRFTIR